MNVFEFADLPFEFDQDETLTTEKMFLMGPKALRMN